MIEEDKTLAFLFPGQGSQSVGMMNELAAHFPDVASVFSDASEVLGYDLWELVSNGPEDQLNSTIYTQPAMLAAGVATWRVWCAQTGIRPGWMAGHSLGEYTALVCAGVLDFRDGIRLVAERAKLMQEAVPAGVGAMAAILGLSDDQVVQVCNEASTQDSVVTAANFNSPGQVVISGNREAVLRAMDLAKGAGAKRAVQLPVSVPSHCPLMRPAAERFRGTLASVAVTPSSVRIVHNVDVATHSDPESVRGALEHQLHGPVRWAETIRYLAGQGVAHFIECGPGRVLAGLNRRIVADAEIQSVYDSSSMTDSISKLAGSQ